MATQMLVKHGTRAGYDAELKTGNICERCRKARTVYNRQYTKAARAAGVKYHYNDVIDHLYDTGKRRNTQPPAPHRKPQSVSTAQSHTGEPEQVTTGTEQHSTGNDSPSLADRLSDALSGFTLKAEPKYVETDDIPDYLHPLDADPEPADGDWAKPKPDEFVITADGMQLIEENMGTYLSVIGMTLEMLDPYCGPILADNLDNMVKRWSKVIARYPAAAKLFMSQGGGILMDWIGAIQATWPVLFAIYEHHLAKTIITEKGRVMRVTSPNGRNVDATMPPQPEYDYTTQ